MESDIFINEKGYYTETPGEMFLCDGGIIYIRKDGVYRLSDKDNKWRLVGKIPEYYFLKNASLPDIGIKVCNDSFFLFGKEKIAALKVNHDGKIEKEILLNDTNNIELKTFCEIVFFDNFAVIIPRKFETGLVLFDFDSLQYDVLQGWEAKLNDYMKQNGISDYWVRYASSCVDGREIAMTVGTGKADYLIWFDMQKTVITDIQKMPKQGIFNSLYISNGNYWMHYRNSAKQAGADACLIEWNRRSKRIDKKVVLGDGQQSRAFIIAENDDLIMAHYDGRLYRINSKSFQKHILSDSKGKLMQCSKKDEKIEVSIIRDDCIDFYNSQGITKSIGLPTNHLEGFIDRLFDNVS